MTVTMLSLLGCSSSNGDEAAVTVKMFRFTPAEVTVQPGTTATWTNLDEIEHTVTAGTPDARTGAFDHVFGAEPGGEFSFTFDEPGAYSYFCDRHQFMRGVIEVN